MLKYKPQTLLQICVRSILSRIRSGTYLIIGDGNFFRNNFRFDFRLRFGIFTILCQIDVINLKSFQMKVVQLRIKISCNQMK